MKNDTSTVKISVIEYESLKSKNAELEAEITELSSKVKWLMEQMRLAKHKQFGASSEKSEMPEQLGIFNEAEATSDLSVPEPELSEVKSHYRKHRRSVKDRLPEDLPVEIIEHALPEDERDCPDCWNEMHIMGHETREELKIIPAKAVIVRHVRNVYACRDCEKNSSENNQHKQTTEITVYKTKQLCVPIPTQIHSYK